MTFLVEKTRAGKLGPSNASLIPFESIFGRESPVTSGTNLSKEFRFVHMCRAGLAPTSVL